MADERTRIERVWKITNQWATAFDGTPHEAFLPDIALDDLQAALDALMQNTPKFDVGAIWDDSVSDEELAGMTESWDYVELMRAGKIVELSINTIAELAGFDLDLHLIVRARPDAKADVEIIWWSDQAFPDDTDWRARFDAMLTHFIILQERFGAQKLYLGPENLDRPGEGKSNWVLV